MKKKVFSLQSKLQILNKEFQFFYNNYNIQNRICLEIKNRIEELIESKAAYENVVGVLNKEIKTMNMFNNNGTEFYKNEGVDIINHENFIKVKRSTGIKVKLLTKMIKMKSIVVIPVLEVLRAKKVHHHKMKLKK